MGRRAGVGPTHDGVRRLVLRHHLRHRRRHQHAAHCGLRAAPVAQLDVGVQAVAGGGPVARGQGLAQHVGQVALQHAAHRGDAALHVPHKRQVLQVREARVRGQACGVKGGAMVRELRLLRQKGGGGSQAVRKTVGTPSWRRGWLRAAAASAVHRSSARASPCPCWPGRRGATPRPPRAPACGWSRPGRPCRRPGLPPSPPAASPPAGQAGRVSVCVCVVCVWRGKGGEK
jgi:hypothetical protein